MSINPLNDISRVYLEHVATQEVEIDEGMTLKDYKKKRSALKQKEKRAAEKTSPLRRAGIHADKASPERAARHRANVDPDYDYGDEENMYPGGKLKNPKKIRKAKALGELGEALDPVGREDADIDNDGDTDKSDKYLHKRRKAIGKAIATRKEEKEQPSATDKLVANIKRKSYYDVTRKSVPDRLDVDRDGNKLEPMKKALRDKEQDRIKKKLGVYEGKETKRWWDDDGDGIGYEKGEVSGKFKKKKKSVKEGFSNWREDLVEVMTDIESEKKVTEKKVNNKIQINPKLDLGEAVEELGGTLLEMVEIDEMDYILESVYDELLEEGYNEDDIEEAIEYSLTEAKVTLGHDTAPEKKKSGLMSATKARLSSLKKTAKQAVATGARKVAKGALGVARKMEGGDKKPHTAARKPSTYRGAGVGTKERVGSGSYQAPTKKKAEPVEDPWKGSETAPPKEKKTTKAKAKTTKVSGSKAPAKRKRTSKLDDLLASVRSESVQIDEKTLTAAETKEKERLVKSMKDKSADFEKRYPGRGKEVMYATATKMAKKMAEQALELQPKTSSTQKPDQQQKKLQQSQDRMRQQEVQILQRKLQALRSAPKGTDPSITAGYEPEGEMVAERTRYAKETGKKFGGAGRPSEEGGNPQIKKRMEKEPWLKYGGSRQPKKVPGKKPPRAGEPGSGVQDPAHRVAVRRASVERAKEQRIGSRFD